MKHVAIYLVVLALLIPPAVGAQANFVSPGLVERQSPRVASLGGPHAALADDYTVLFTNPAGFNAAPAEFRVSELTLGLTGPIFSISSIIFEGMRTDITELLASPEVGELLTSLYARAALIGPLSFGYVGNGLGFSVTADTRFTAEGTSTTGLSARIQERLMLSGGFALPVPLPATWNSSLDAGLLLKGVIAGEGGFSSSFLELPEVLANLGPGLVMNEPFDITTGIGMDAGVRYGYGERLAAGITAANIVAPTVTNEYDTLQDFIDNKQPRARPTGRIPPEISFGMLYRPPLGIVGRYISDLTLLLDYRDIFDFWLAPATAENILLKLGFGAEVKLLEVLSVRAGLAEGLLTTGLGIDLTYFDMNLAIFGSELSTEPGLRPVFNVLVGFEFSL